MTETSIRFRWQSIVETLALVVVPCAVAWTAIARSSTPVTDKNPTRRPEPALPTKPISLAGAQLRGDKGAKVGLVVYSDFQCPFCGKFARETLPAIEKQYVDSGKVLLAFRQFPLPIHQFAQQAAEASACAGRQGKFWEFHDQLFANQDKLDPSSLRDRADKLGLQGRLFAGCLDAGETASLVQTDKTGGTPLGVTGTPTFLVGPMLPDGTLHVSQRFSGALPLSQFQSVLDRFTSASPLPAGQ